MPVAVIYVKCVRFLSLTMLWCFPLNLGFTLLALDLPNSAPHDLQPSPLLAMIQCFGWDEMLRPLLVARYLNTLLQNEYMPSFFPSFLVFLHFFLPCLFFFFFIVFLPDLLPSALTLHSLHSLPSFLSSVSFFSPYFLCL